MGKKEIIVDESENLITQNFTEDFTIEEVANEKVEEIEFTEDVTLYEVQPNLVSDKFIFVRENCTVSHEHKLIFCCSEVALVLNLPHINQCKKHGKMTISNAGSVETVKLICHPDNHFKSSLNDNQYMLAPYQKVKLVAVGDCWYCI